MSFDNDAFSYMALKNMIYTNTNTLIQHINVGVNQIPQVFASTFNV